jgi:hypothetical protein
MKWFLMSLVVAASALIATENADAAGRRQGPSRGYGYGMGRSYHETRGEKFSHGYFYRGRDHFHWTYRYFWSRYGCDCFYCPSTCCWYYWYEPKGCYFPTSYINFATPVPTTNTAAAAAASSSAVGPTVIAPTVITTPGVTPGPVPPLPEVPATVAPPVVQQKNSALGGNVKVGPN